MEKYSVKNIKEWMTFLIAVANFAGKKVESGKSMGFMDFGKVLPLLMQLGPAIEGSKMVGKEVMDLSDPEKAELIEHMKTLDLPNDMIERKLEEGMALMVTFADYIGDFFEGKK